MGRQPCGVPSDPKQESILFVLKGMCNWQFLHTFARNVQKKGSMSVEHTGRIEQRKGNTVQVRIAQQSACGSCEASGRCLAENKSEAIIEAFTDDTSLHPGDTVVLMAHKHTGLKAVFLAYVFPLLLLVSSLVLSLTLLFPGNETVAALLALLVPVIYYCLLVPFKRQLAGTFRFKATALPIDKLSTTNEP